MAEPREPEEIRDPEAPDSAPESAPEADPGKGERRPEAQPPKRQEANQGQRRRRPQSSPSGGDGNKRPWRRISKTLAFWFIFLLVAIFASKFLGSNTANDEMVLGYKEYKELLKEGRIESATIIENEFHGKLLEPQTTFARGPQQTYDTFVVNLGVIDSETIEEWESNGVDFRFQNKPFNWLNVFFNFLPWLLFVGLWLFILRQMQGGPKGAFSFGKSRAKLVSEDRPKITFKDVGGAEEAKQELEEIIEFLKDPRKFQRLGGRIPKGVLLIGPPGTGKTYMAKAVAGEASVPFFSMSGSDFVEMFVGVGASRVRDLFEQGRNNAPCIIFIDEMDAVGRHRGAGIGGGHDEREQTLNQLLVEMDGFESKEGVILIAATNRPDVLDPALMRPGRFDRQVIVDLPDVRGRESMLRIHTRNIPLGDDVDVKVLARGTPGLSGADLENLVNEAALLASRHDSQRVEMVDFEAAKDKVMMGVERSSMAISDDEKKLTAYHEIGHALIAKLIPESDPVHKVTIIPRGRGLGLTTYLPLDERHTLRESYCRARLAYTLGGRIAEKLAFGEITTGASNDYAQATELARRMVCDWGMSERLGPLSYGHKQEEVFLGRDFSHHRDYSEETAVLIDQEIKRLVTEGADRAESLLNDKMDLLHKMAEVLLEHEVLDDAQLDSIMRGEVLDPPKNLRNGRQLATGKDPADENPAKKPRTEEANTVSAEPGEDTPSTPEQERPNTD